MTEGEEKEKPSYLPQSDEGKTIEIQNADTRKGLRDKNQIQVPIYI